MALIDTVNAGIAAAMKAHDAARLSALRMLKAALVNKSVERGRELDDAEALLVVASLVIQRRESIEQFLAGGRTDLADKGAGSRDSTSSRSRPGGYRRGD
jgi:uncharacterized protein YqeY